MEEVIAVLVALIKEQVEINKDFLEVLRLLNDRVNKLEKAARPIDVKKSKPYLKGEH